MSTALSNTNRMAVSGASNKYDEKIRDSEIRFFQRESCEEKVAST